MNPTSAQYLGLDKNSRHSARRMPRILAATLCLLFLTAVPAFADTVKINQVVQTLTSSKGTQDLRLNTLVAQDPVSPGTKDSTQKSGPAAAGSQDAAKTDAISPTVVVTGEGQRLGVDIIEEGEVEGTICDCGEIFVAGGAFPKWPFLFLAAVPLVFISDCDDCDTPSSSPTPTPTPPSTPTPTPTPTPEPASLLLFGTGLLAAGAGLRRRHARSKLAEQPKAQEEE